MAEILSPNEYLTERALAELWNVKRNTLQKWRSLGVGPKFVKRVGRIVYRKADIEDYEQSQTYQGTGQKCERMSPADVNKIIDEVSAFRAAGL